jgi:endonuclease YncB( thermonuclease family)
LYAAVLLAAWWLWAPTDDVLQDIISTPTVSSLWEPAHSTSSEAAIGALTGRASVIDGDTIEIHGARVRLHGIDAPESNQVCTDAAGAAYRCGQRAALALADRVGSAPVSCDAKDKDRYGRIVAVCSLDGIDLNSWLVREGLAIAYRKYSTDYVREEEAARAAKLGLWAGKFQAPWDFRAVEGDATMGSTNQQVSPQIPSNVACQIKGNINSKGERIYHRPGGKWYDETQIDESRGERWFCSEAEAVASGWRPSKR